MTVVTVTQPNAPPRVVTVNTPGPPGPPGLIGPPGPAVDLAGYVTAAAFAAALAGVQPLPLPAPFALAATAGATAGALVTSAPVVVAGPAGAGDTWPVTCDGVGSPEVSVAGSAWTAGRVPAAAARAGDTLRVRQTAGGVGEVRTALVRVGGRSTAWVAGVWSPADLPGLAPTLQVARSRAAGLLWQDAAKTVPAAAPGDPVRVATCPDTGVDWAAPSDAARPVLSAETGGRWSLHPDGSDDVMVRAGAATAGEFAAYFVSQLAASPLAFFGGGSSTGSTLNLYGGYAYLQSDAGGVSGPFATPAGWLVVRFRRDAAGAWYARHGAGAEAYVGTQAAPFTLRSVLSTAGTNQYAPWPCAGHVFVAGAVSAADDARVVDYLSSLAP